MFSASSKIRFTKLRAAGAVVLLGALSFGGVVAAQSASAAGLQSDQNYIPRGCSGSSDTYITYSLQRQDCKIWPAWLALHPTPAATPAAAAATAPASGSVDAVLQSDWNYIPNGCKQAGRTTYTTNSGAVRNCGIWPAWNRQQIQANQWSTPTTQAPAPAPAPAASTTASVLATNPGYIPNGCKRAGATTYTTTAGTTRSCGIWPAWNSQQIRSNQWSTPTTQAPASLLAANEAAKAAGCRLDPHRLGCAATSAPRSQNKAF